MWIVQCPMDDSVRKTVNVEFVGRMWCFPYFVGEASVGLPNDSEMRHFPPFLLVL